MTPKQVLTFLTSPENAPVLNPDVVRGYTDVSAGDGTERHVLVMRCAAPCRQHEVMTTAEVTARDDASVESVTAWETTGGRRLRAWDRIEVAPVDEGVRVSWTVTYELERPPSDHAAERGIEAALRRGKAALEAGAST